MTTPPAADERPAAAESAVIEYLQRIGRIRDGRRAVHIHLSKLRPYNRREQHVRIATNTFENLVRLHDGQLFTLSNADLLFVCKGASIMELDAAVLKVRYLFSEDPIARAEDAQEGDRFCTWYDLEQDYDRLVGDIHRIGTAERRKSAAPADPLGALAPLDPAHLGRLEQVLTQADLSSVIRRQAVCAILKNAPPQPIFNELFVSIADLQRVIAPKTNLASDRWLFQHLTQTLDKRMLATLPRIEDSSLAARFSLNLNVATLLSQEFLNFDATLKHGARGTLVVELQTIDVFADMGSFVFARDFVRERGYRVCLDGLSHLTAALIERERLGFDLIKIVWSPDMADDAGRRLEALRETVQRAGEARVILCRCDSDDAIRMGQFLGISLFQGRHVDALLAAGRKASVLPAREAARA